MKLLDLITLINLLLSFTGTIVYAICLIYHKLYKVKGVFDEEDFYYKILCFLNVMCIILGYINNKF